VAFNTSTSTQDFAKEMPQNTTQAPIDLRDMQHSLQMVIEKEMNFLDHLRQLSLMDDDKKAVYISLMV
jgi:hypothetical protein